MSDIEILKEMFKNTATVSLEEHPLGSGRKLVKLVEHDPFGSYSVTVYGMPDDADVIVIKADEFTSQKAVFTGSKGECKRADFVIIVNLGKKKIILCIEMKAKNTTSSQREIIQQLKGARCFIAYCQEIGKMFWDEKNFLDSYSDRYVSIRNISIPKKQTRMDPEAGIHDRPDRMLKIGSPYHLQLNQSIGGS
ncbi:MAG: hypothetical protein L0Y39_04695 [Methylococcaceae bacterium]|nr:hypothetical protein [Methylococcaceae bacterium]